MKPAEFCRNSKTGLHLYGKAFFEDKKEMAEECKRCSHVLVTHKDGNGRIDNGAYYRHHRRDFLQPYHKGYEIEYPEKIKNTVNLAKIR